MTTEERVEKLEKKLVKSERRSRVMLSMAVLTVAGMFLLGAGGDKVGKVVSAEEFRLVDQTGNTRAFLGLSNGLPGLGLLDQNDSVRAMLLLSKSGQPLLDLNDQNGNIRAQLELRESGQPWLRLSDQNGKARAILAINESGQPGLRLFDQKDTTRAELFLDESGQPRLGLFDQNGKTIWHAP